jgi:hypothetical protein
MLGLKIPTFVQSGFFYMENGLRGLIHMHMRNIATGRKRCKADALLIGRVAETTAGLVARRHRPDIRDV